MKIIHKPKFEPVTCECCGCLYEFERGDDITIVRTYYRDRAETSAHISCPICGSSNQLRFKEEA